MSDIFQLAKSSEALTIYQVLNQSSDLIIWNGLDFKFVMANEVFINKTGFNTLDNIVDSRYEDQPSEGGRFYEEWIKHDKIVHQTLDEVHLISFLRFNGDPQRKLLYGVKKPAYDSQNNLIGTTSSYRDITKLPQAQLLSWVLEGDCRKFPMGNYKDGAFTFVLAHQFEDNMGRIKLTQRQSECLFLMLRSTESKEIARYMGISPRTVEIYIAQLKEKFHAHNKKDIIATAMINGFANYMPKRWFV